MDHLGQNLSNLSLLYRIYQANAAYISAVAAKYNILFIRSAGGKICQTQRFDIPSTFFVEFQQEEQVYIRRADEKRLLCLPDRPLVTLRAVMMLRRASCYV